MSWVMAAAARRELGRAEAVAPSAGGVRVVGSVSRTGHQTTTASFNADGSRATVSSASANLLTHVITTKVSVYDTDTGRQIGRTTTTRTTVPRPGAAVLDTAAATTLDGESLSVLNPAGTRAVVTTGITNPTTNARTTKVTVIDTATGNQVGEVTTLAGEMWPQTSYSSPPIAPPAPTPNGACGLGPQHRHYAPGFMLEAPVFSNDRKNVTFTSSGGNAATSTTWVGVLDTSSGTQIGSTLAFSGPGNSSANFSDDGSHLLVVTPAGQPPGRLSTQASVVNTITGTQIGKTVTFVGGGGGVISADGAHAMILANTYNVFALTTTTRVSFLRIT